MRRRDLHGLEAAGAGEVVTLDAGEPLGACPSCGAPLSVVHAEDPSTRRICRALLHPVPFCTYFGETDPSVIERAVQRARKILSS
jgi:hypothetical protein